MTQEDHSPALRRLLELIRTSSPKKSILRPLQTILDVDPPEDLFHKGMAGAREDHVKIVEGVGEEAGPIHYQVVWGALDVNVWEGWQNPSTNSAIRQSILETAHEAVKRKTIEWSNVAYVQVRITQEGETHNLNLLPFRDSESCTVSHLQFKQSMFDENGPERGILNLSQDHASVHAIPGGQILPLASYVCLGAHRNGRLNETQLNYVHSKGVQAHGFDTSLLPDAKTIQWGKTGMIPAKATRVSCKGLDIMASSFHVADQVYTTISVVQYPPFGTHFDTARQPKTQTPPYKTGFEETEIQGATLRTIPGHSLFHGEGLSSKQKVERKTGNKRTEKQKVLLYTYERRHLEPLNVNFSEQDLRKRSKPWWTKELPVYQYYFVDGVYGDPYDKTKRFFMFDFNTTNRCTRRLEDRAREIMRGLWSTHSAVWNPQISFYDNVRDNKKTAFIQVGTNFIERTIGQQWSVQWKHVIRDEIFTQQQLQGPAAIFATVYMGDNFWYTPTEDTWKYIIGNMHTRERYLEFSNQKYREHEEHIALNKVVLAEDQVPIPKVRSKPPKAQETALVSQRQQENTQFLLAQVLQRLDSMEVHGD